MTADPSSQWQCLLRNVGAWEGSFTRLSPQGELVEDVRSIVTFEPYDEDRSMRQTLEFFTPTGELKDKKVLEYSSLNRNILLFENGAFSLGSIQAAPFGEFGAELGLIQGKRRLRLVELFQSKVPSRFTLIREFLRGEPRVERPPLTVDQLVGDWRGEAITIYPDWQSPSRYETTLTIHTVGDRLTQTLTMPGREIASSAAIDGSILRFDQGSYPMQMLLLPDGASANTPLEIPSGKPFFLEAGWLFAENQRQRMIRSYDSKGGWSSLTLITERRI
ncbi:MAG: DUF3598 family protein [Microcoleus sp. SIO2G3]|nr:DUF3598 family protein [Microcoleus sp. SIO2G3]